MSNLLDEPVTVIYEDISMTFTKFPKPLKVATRDVIKQEADPVSESIPYFVTVCFFFFYYFLVSFLRFFCQSIE